MTLQTASTSQIVIPLTKIDHARRMVIGVAALEQPDLAKEIMDYETAKPAFESWSKSFEDATNGLSKGNLRVMHTKTAVGRIDQIAFNDDAKCIEVCAKVSDENEWQKCLDGVYTGFSVGGGYAKKWKDGDLTRYTPRVAELSLVDSPCMPGARFAELLKADGMVEQLELRGRDASPAETFADLWKRKPEPVPTFADAWANRPMTFGELAKADPNHDSNGKFADGATAAAAGAAGVGAAAIAGQAKHHYDEAQKHLGLMQYHVRQAEMHHGKYLNTALSSRDRSLHADLSFNHQDSANEAREAFTKSYAKYHTTVGARLLRGASRIGVGVAHRFR